jgi:hypothetical protein
VMTRDTDATIRSDVSSAELLAAVTQFLKERVVPALSGRDQFNARVAANVLGIIDREQAIGPRLEELDGAAAAKWLPANSSPPHTAVDIARALANRKITIDDDFMKYLKARQLLVTAINNPRYPSRTIAEERWHGALEDD